ncbi:MAG: hypothetical protein R6V45_01340 [Oceanipulchritudo sp.]
MSPFSHRLLPLTFFAALLGCLLGSAPAMAVDITGVEAGNVTPFSADLVWEVSDAGTGEPDLEVFLDSGGTEPVGSGVSVEFFPLHLGDRSVSSDYERRISRRALKEEIKIRNLLMARVSGLDPGTTYYLRPRVLDTNDKDLTGNGPVDPVAVTTALENAFVGESRQLVLDFSASAPELSHGAIARVSSPGLAYPLFEVVGDGAVASEAFFNLDNLLDSAGERNLDPSNPLDLNIQLRGMGALEGVMTYTVAYGGGSVTAEAVVLPYDAEEVTVDSFVFDPVGDQVVGASFSVTIRALDANGDVLNAFSGTADISGNLALSEGGGQTPVFSSGVLSGLPLTVAESGSAQLTATETGGSATGTSETFTVSELVWALTTNAVPSSGGTVTPGGTFANGSVVPLEAVPAETYLFDGWIGEGIADLEAAVTTVSMTADRSITAVFVEDSSLESYEEFQQTYFQRLSSDSEFASPDYDYDGDGLSNLLEYAFGTDPVRPDKAQRRPRMNRDGENGEPYFTFVRKAGTTDLSMTIETGSTLKDDWAPHNPEPEMVTVVDLGDGYEEVSVKMPVPTVGNPSFVRLNVTLTAP